MNNQNTVRKMPSTGGLYGKAYPTPSTWPRRSLAGAKSVMPSKKSKIKINLNHVSNISKARIKVNKMNKFKIWFRNWLYDDHNDEAEKPLAHDDDHRNYEDDKTLKFNVTTARGGVILTVRNYDQRQDRHFYTAHVLHDDQNIAEGVAQIVSMELLRTS
jgi:hypothetical protein